MGLVVGFERTQSLSLEILYIFLLFSPGDEEFSKGNAMQVNCLCCYCFAFTIFTIKKISLYFYPIIFGLFF